ncbi:hypothetical protein JE952_002464 [Flavobacterium psychrophilum]|nr:hypothetical protein [Flavobacterium psychrophilum]
MEKWKIYTEKILRTTAVWRDWGFRLNLKMVLYLENLCLTEKSCIFNPQHRQAPERWKQGANASLPTGAPSFQLRAKRNSEATPSARLLWFSAESTLVTTIVNIFPLTFEILTLENRFRTDSN